MFSLDSILEELDKIGKKESIKRLHNLYSVAENKKTRIKILEILNTLKDNSHYKEIENYFISDEDTDVRIEAAKLLAFNYNDRKAIDPLIWVLENEKKREVKYTALRLLAAFIYRDEFKESIINSLKRLLSSSDKKLKMDAAEYLGLIKDQSSIDLLIENLNSSNKLVRMRIIQALGKLKSEKAVPKLIENLTLESSDVWKFTFDASLKILGSKKLSKFFPLPDPLHHNTLCSITSKLMTLNYSIKISIFY